MFKYVPNILRYKKEEQEVKKMRKKIKQNNKNI